MTDGPLCVFCGSEFPVELERCPTCGRPWIDQRLSEVTDGTIVPLAEAGKAPDMAIDTEPGRRVPLWMIAGGVTLIALSVYGVVFSLLLDDGGGAVAANTTTTAVSAAAPTTTQPAPVTTGPPSTAPPTTVAATTTTTTTPPTTTTTTTLPPIEEGTAIAIGDVTLGAFALGPLQVGSNGTTALGRLAATFGQPTEITPLSGGQAGICDTDVGRIVSFGGIGAILVGDPGDERFVGYVYSEGPPGHPADGLQTLSGAGLGNTIAEVDALYAGSIVAAGDLDGRPHLFILRSSDRRTLLWGALSDATDDAVLIGINAPYWCDDGPFLP